MKVEVGTPIRISQGDIYQNVEFIEYAIEDKGVIEVAKIVFPYVIILTQDCDLKQDYRVRYEKSAVKTQDKQIISVLVAPLYNVEHVYQGEHLTDVGIQMRTIKKKSSEDKNLKHNEIPRYHYLEFPSDIPMVPSIIDFKHYFSVNVGYLEKKKCDFVCSVAYLYREDISHRFGCFLSRIGLPEELHL